MNNFKMNPRAIGSLPESDFPRDPTFASRLERAIAEPIEVYFAAVRPARIVPLPTDYDPEANSIGCLAGDVQGPLTVSDVRRAMGLS